MKSSSNKKIPLSDFETQLEQLRTRTQKTSITHPVEPPTQTSLGVAFRIGVELVVAIGVCTGIGILLDSYWETKPWGMVSMFVLGGCAGIRNVYRTALQLQDKNKTTE